MAEAGLLDINGTFIVEVIAFIAMIAVLGRYAYPRIMRAAEARQSQIESALREAERTRQEVGAALAQAQEQIDGARGEARELIARAQQEAKLEAEELRAKAREEAELVVSRAREELGAERDRAIRELRAQTSALVVEAASRVLGEAIDARAHQRLIEESLDQVGTA